MQYDDTQYPVGRPRNQFWCSVLLERGFQHSLSTMPQVQADVSLTPEPVVDTEEVREAKALFFAAYEEALDTFAAATAAAPKQKTEEN